jgi:hypothetical protein
MFPIPKLAELPIKPRQGQREPGHGPRDKMTIDEHGPCPSRLSRWLFLIAINKRIASEYLQEIAA